MRPTVLLLERGGGRLRGGPGVVRVRLHPRRQPRLRAGSRFDVRGRERRANDLWNATSLFLFANLFARCWPVFAKSEKSTLSTICQNIVNSLSTICQHVGNTLQFADTICRSLEARMQFSYRKYTPIRISIPNPRKITNTTSLSACC